MDDYEAIRALVKDHNTVLYGEWKNGVRTPGIVEYIQEARNSANGAKAAAVEAARDAKSSKDRSDRNRTLLIGTFITAGVTLLVKLAELIAQAHVNHP